MLRNTFSKRLLLVTAVLFTASLMFFANACNEKLGVVDAEKDFPAIGDISSEFIGDFGEGYLIGFHGKPDEDLVRGAGGRVIHTYRNFPVIHMDIPEQALKGLERAPGVKFIERNGIARTMFDFSSHCPANEYYCAHGKIKTYHLSRIGAQAAWQSSTGQGIRIAILDTGIDGSHKDLKKNLAQDGFTAFNTGPPRNRHWHVDPDGHGTHVAGIAGASGQVGDYTNALAGVAPDVTLVSVRVLGGGGGTWSNIAAGIDWCIDNEIDIINMSLGGVYSETVDLSTQTAWNAGLLLVAAAGNMGAYDNDDVIYPAALGQVIAVSSANLEVDNIRHTSSRGLEVELIAPGSSIFSTYTNELGYVRMSGTSMASPFVAGVAALIWSSNASLSHQEVRDLLSASVEDLGLDQSLQGAGLVRADKALGVETVHLSGVVSGSGSDDPLFAATLSLDQNGTGFSTVTAGDMGYHLFVPAGDYAVTVSYPYDFDDLTDVLTVNDNQPAVHDFILSDDGDDNDNGEPPPVETFTITATAGEGGSITPSGPVTVNEGADQSFTIIADDGYQISYVLVDGYSVSVESSYTFENVTADHTIHASFAAVPNYTITSSAGDDGSINPLGEVVVNEGANQTFSIIANEGFQISDVKVNGILVEVESSYTFYDVTANHTIHAEFETAATAPLPIADFTLTNTSNPQFARVMVDWEVSGEDLTEAELKITGPNSETQELPVSGDSASGQHEFSFRRGWGTYTVILKVTDNNGTTEERKEITL